MQKKVNVKASVPVVGIKHPIVGNVKGIVLDVEEILICIHEKAKVEEVIGSRTIPLDFINYDKDNHEKEEVKVPEEKTEATPPVVPPTQEPVITTPVKEEPKVEITAEVSGTVIVPETPVIADKVEDTKVTTAKTYKK